MTDKLDPERELVIEWQAAMHVGDICPYCNKAWKSAGEFSANAVFAGKEFAGKYQWAHRKCYLKNTR